MAQKIKTFFIDDLDGSEASGTVSFSLDGTNYEIDLNDVNSGELHAALAPYVEAARTVSASKKTAGRRPSAAGVDTQAIRAWAARTGVALKSRGRIPATVVEKYRAAQ